MNRPTAKVGYTHAQIEARVARRYADYWSVRGKHGFTIPQDDTHALVAAVALCDEQPAGVITYPNGDLNVTLIR